MPFFFLRSHSKRRLRAALKNISMKKAVMKTIWSADRRRAGNTGIQISATEVHVHSADCFQDKFLEGAMDGDFLADYTGEDAGTSLLEAAADAGEETGTSLLEVAEDAGDTAVNEQAADSALDLEAEEVEETAGEAQTLSGTPQGKPKQQRTSSLKRRASKQGRT